MENMNFSPEMQNPNVDPNPSVVETPTKKNWYWVVAVALIMIVVGFSLAWWYMGQMNFNLSPVTGVRTPSPEENEEAQINESIESVDVGNLDVEFEEIDADLNSL